VRDSTTRISLLFLEMQEVTRVESFMLLYGSKDWTKAGRSA